MVVVGLNVVVEPTYLSKGYQQYHIILVDNFLQKFWPSNIFLQINYGEINSI